MCGLYLFAPLEGVAQKFTIFRKSLSCTVFLRAFLFCADYNPILPCARESLKNCSEMQGILEAVYEYSDRIAWR